MVHVVRTVEGIPTYPTRGEHELKTNSIGAVRVEIGLVGKIVAHEGGLSWLGIVEAVDANGQLFENILVDVAFRPPHGLFGIGGVAVPRGGEVAPLVVSSNHPKAWLEWLDIFAVEEIVPGNQ